MRIYSITPIGRAVGGSTTPANPNDPKWRVLSYLRRVDRSTDDRIATYLGMSRGEVILSLAHLTHGDKPLVVRE